MKCGLLGRRLGHSYSPQIHAMLGDYSYELFERDIIDNIKNGLAGAIYTQVSDVEDETNGLFTYDRKVLKVKKEMMLKIKSMIDKEFNHD